jgi:hypothetical protein
MYVRVILTLEQSACKVLVLKTELFLYGHIQKCKLHTEVGMKTKSQTSNRYICVRHQWCTNNFKCGWITQIHGFE